MNTTDNLDYLRGLYPDDLAALVLRDMNPLATPALVRALAEQLADHALDIVNREDLEHQIDRLQADLSDTCDELADRERELEALQAAYDELEART